MGFKLKKLIQMCFEMAFLIQLFPIQLHDSDLTTLHAETQKEHYFLSSLIFMNYTDESEKKYNANDSYSVQQWHYHYKRLFWLVNSLH